MYHNLAKQLRHRSTDAERILWGRLRAHRMTGLKFRRHQPLGNYIVDFDCLEKRLIIELDGRQHALNSAQDTELSAQGYKILRIWNTDIFNNLEGVMQTIVDACSGVEQ